jgi:hypothetical protein
MPDDVFTRISKRLTERPWYEKPRLFAMGDLFEIRNELRAKNLHDTEEPPMQVQDPSTVDPAPHATRSTDGTFNDLSCPAMGAVGRRFGRNMPLQHVFPDSANLLIPSPRVVSRELMTRHEFQPATILNLLAAAWIQFMVHDWFVHKRSATDTIDLPLAPGDDWSDPAMRIPRTEPDAAPPNSKRPPAYANLNSHWWDASQIYGGDPVTAAKLRTQIDGRLRIEPTGLLPVDPESGLAFTGFTDNWWIGLAMLHTLFTLEHNHICDLLAHQNPGWNDEQLFTKARLINSALMAKIHTVEWTPAILPHPVIQLGMQVNWAGLAGDELQDALVFLDEQEVLGGIVGSHADHHTAPYSLTEEFVSVYRMHPLIPDDVAFHSVATGRHLESRRLDEVSARRRSPSESRWPISSTHSGSATPARSGCTTTRGCSRICTATTASTSILRRSTSSAIVNAGFRATTSSGACSARVRSSPSTS